MFLAVFSISRRDPCPGLSPFSQNKVTERFHSRDHYLCKVIETKKKPSHKKRVQLPQDWLGKPTWPAFHCFGTPIGSLSNKDGDGCENVT